LVSTIEMPRYGTTFYIPRFTAVSGVVGPTPEDNVNPAQTVSATDQIAAPIATFAGVIATSQQLFERGNFDQIAVQDFAESYASDLQAQLVSGSGANGQLLGLLNVSTSTVDGVPGAVANTYTDASPTPAKLIGGIAQLAANVADTRERPPSALLMRAARYFWLAGSYNTSDVEVEQKVGTGVVPTDSDVGPYGPVAGLPIYFDQTIPTTLGGGGNQDAVIAVRAKDIILLEDEPRFNAVIGSAAGGSNLAVFLTWHTYAAAFVTRYPSGIGSVTGTGFQIPAGW
jgi:HK97 family phage major capsid protein